MKEKIVLILKGMLLGIANIIPGVSGGTIAVALGIYEKIIGTISHFFEHWKENLIFIGYLGIGMVLSIVLLSKGIAYALDNYTLITKLFFVGLILGGVPLIIKKIRNYVSISNIITFLITAGLIIAITLMNAGNNAISFSNLNVLSYIILFIVGLVAAGTMIVPGISGSFVLMLLGYYYPILNAINNLASFKNIFNNLIILGIFGIGVIVGIVLVAKLIEFLLNKYEVKTYFGILGFIIASIPSILLQRPSLVVTPTGIIVGIVLCLIGGLISYKLGDK